MTSGISMEIPSKTFITQFMNLQNFISNLRLVGILSKQNGKDFGKNYYREKNIG
jgi:hypothetical protein